ncbi:MAG TPA: GyrI-like domain-containing protein [Jiangellaceae bacterium]|nr:GyrI-like domain-containing protein [Jiangellaceae bacterium]
MTTKVDLKRDLREVYTATRRPQLVTVPELRFLMIDGHGDPNTAPAYAEAVQSIYAVAYAAKFIVKKAPGGIDFAVMPLEGLWWSSDMSAFTTDDKSVWDWTMMIAQPDQVTPEVAKQAQATAAKKGLAAIDRVRLEPFTEGLAAQIMHIGPYSAEGPTIRMLHEFIADQGYERSGKHHEIYLGDPRRSSPEKMKTIVRQPVVLASTRR